jgi:hypothetical protein
VYSGQSNMKWNKSSSEPLRKSSLTNYVHFPIMFGKQPYLSNLLKFQLTRLQMLARMNTLSINSVLHRMKFHTTPGCVVCLTRVVLTDVYQYSFVLLAVFIYFDIHVFTKLTKVERCSNLLWFNCWSVDGLEHSHFVTTNLSSSISPLPSSYLWLSYCIQLVYSCHCILYLTSLFLPLYTVFN